ncbi:MAG: prepilin-type N-terminal cleavage/methylation domain-containing protein [Nitrospirae bacterium]|nr:prepilin-type N-terminal cleavage/methylation domain-containing protein [Nitrospirota bacterium]
MRILRVGICSKGFTFLELIVVIFILSIVMAVIMPSFIGIGDNKLKSEAREIASLLRYLYDSAVSRKETFLIKFNFNENTVSFSSPEGEKRKKFNNVIGVTTQSRGLVSTGELIFFFEPLGINENLNVHLNKENEFMDVTLNHMSGRVKIIQNSK